MGFSIDDIDIRPSFLNKRTILEDEEDGKQYDILSDLLSKSEEPGDGGLENQTSEEQKIQIIRRRKETLRNPEENKLRNVEEEKVA